MMSEIMQQVIADLGDDSSGEGSSSNDDDPDDPYDSEKLTATEDPISP